MRTGIMLIVSRECDVDNFSGKFMWTLSWRIALTVPAHTWYAHTAYWVWRHYAVPDYVHIKSSVFQGRTAWDIWPQIFVCSWIDSIWIPGSFHKFFKFKFQIAVIEFQSCSLPLSLLVSVPLSFPVSLYFYPWITTSTYASW